MTNAISLRGTKILALILSAVLFSLIYLIFVAHTFAQTTDQSADRAAQRLKVCQIHERNIKTRLDSLTRLVANQEEKFASIAARVENHYTTKMVPKGEVLSNYDALVADIAAKKTAADGALSTAKSDVASFSCSAPDPKSQLTTFRKDMQKVKSALKEYRKSIRNLIVALRALTPSPTPGGTK